MIKNFLFRFIFVNMFYYLFVWNIKNEGYVVELLKKYFIGIIKKRQKKGKIYEFLFIGMNSQMRVEFIYLFFLEKIIFVLRIRLKVKF